MQQLVLSSASQQLLSYFLIVFSPFASFAVELASGKEHRDYRHEDLASFLENNFSLLILDLPHLVLKRICPMLPEHES